MWASNWVDNFIGLLRGSPTATVSQQLQWSSGDFWRNITHLAGEVPAAAAAEAAGTAAVGPEAAPEAA